MYDSKEVFTLIRLSVKKKSKLQYVQTQCTVRTHRVVKTIIIKYPVLLLCFSFYTVYTFYTIVYSVPSCVHRSKDRFEALENGRCKDVFDEGKWKRLFRFNIKQINQKKKKHYIRI